MSHLDPRMSWGDLVARMVREAVAWHDPRGGGSGPRRRRAGSAGASRERAPNKTRADGAAAAPAQRGNESSGRAPNRTRAADAPAQRGSDTPAPQGNRTRPAAAPTAPAQRAAGNSPAPQGATAAAGTRHPIAVAPDAAAPRLSAPAAPALGACAGGVPASAPAAAAASRFATGAAADSSHAGAAAPFSPVATSAPQPALGVDPDGAPSGASSAAAAAHTSRGSVRNSHQSPPRRHIPAAVRRLVWHRDQGRCVYRDPLTGRRCTSSHLLQIDHLLPVAEGGGPDPANLALRCFSHHRMRHGYGPPPPPEPPM